MNKTDANSQNPSYKHPQATDRVYEFSNLENQLQNWCNEAYTQNDSHKEFLARLEVTDKIIDCFQKQAPILDLSRSSCSSLPPLSCLTHIKCLDLSDSPMMEIQSTQVDQLIHLEEINLSGSRIRSSLDLKSSLERIPSMKKNDFTRFIWTKWPDD